METDVEQLEGERVATWEMDVSSRQTTGEEQTQPVDG